MHSLVHGLPIALRAVTLKRLTPKPKPWSWFWLGTTQDDEIVLKNGSFFDQP